MHRFRLFLARGLRGALAALRLLRDGWRVLLVLACVGAALGLLWVGSQPPWWVSEGHVALRPLILREGHLLTANELGAHYALRLVAPARVARVWDEVARPDVPHDGRLRLASRAIPGGFLLLEVVHPDAALAEAVNRGLLRSFQREIEAENRTREAQDRLVLSLSRHSMASRASMPLARAAARGAAAGAAFGVLSLLLAAFWQRGRIVAPLEAEQLTGAPTLGAIPARPRLRLFFFP